MPPENLIGPRLVFFLFFFNLCASARCRPSPATSLLHTKYEYWQAPVRRSCYLSDRWELARKRDDIQTGLQSSFAWNPPGPCGLSRLSYFRSLSSFGRKGLPFSESISKDSQPFWLELLVGPRPVEKPWNKLVTQQNRPTLYQAKSLMPCFA